MEKLFAPKKPQPDKKLGIYVHIPFCRSKCQYCDFYSFGGSRDKYLVDGYLQALVTHIKETAERCPEYVVDTVYFGGGTPSFFGADNLRRIFAEILANFRVMRDAEVTYEANPDSITDQQLKKLRREGFNRISIGVQSDDDEMLKKLGRPHNYEQAVQAVEKARAAGFNNISLDLMYGLPNQTCEQWQKTLTHVLELKPEHFSCYGLKVEEGTPLWDYKDCVLLPDDEAQADMYLFAVDTLKNAGYGQYEISNFAKRGHMSQHNLKYWLGEEYIGFGPSAASDFGGMRYTNKADIHAYIEGVLTHGAILDECEQIPMRERAGEYVMLRLRTCLGIEEEEYEKNYLMPFKPLKKLLEPMAEQGLCELEEGRWVLTPKGFLLSNQIIGELQLAQSKSTPLAKKR
ncbi:MAG: radical SAM family heme chaperone HemW [Clostridia bacterium]|nr:radical SAM family heme chaperone HemW [Clostridia bacterium]